MSQGVRDMLAEKGGIVCRHPEFMAEAFLFTAPNLPPVVHLNTGGRGPEIKRKNECENQRSFVTGRTELCPSACGNSNKRTRSTKEGLRKAIIES